MIENQSEDLVRYSRQIMIDRWAMVFIEVRITKDPGCPDCQWAKGESERRDR